MTNESSNEHMEKPGDDVTQDSQSDIDSKVEYSEEACAIFQSQMSDRIQAGEDLAENEHMKNCARCTAFIGELEAIVDALKTMMREKEEEEPSDKLWDKIQSVLKTEGESDKPSEEPPAMLPSDLALETGSV